MGRKARISISGRRIEETGEFYLRMLAFILVGYAVIGKSFAYLGVPPVYIGEMTLGIGIIAVLRSGCLSRVVSNSLMVPLLLLMCWGAFRTFPYFGTYGVLAIRDAVIWGYGIFAFITAAVLISVPERLIVAVKFFRKLTPILLLVLPVVWLAARVLDGVLPEMPLSGGPMLDYKVGDVCVHLAGCFAMIVALGRSMNPWLPPIMVPVNLGLNLQGRAAIMSFFVTAAMLTILRPFHPRAMRIFAVLGLGLFVMWATDLKIENVNGREVSFDALVESMHSIVGDKAADKSLQGTKEWRLKWWTDIVNYTIHGKYFWDGKGFGINLAEDDGYSLDENASIRSPHNGHLTILARSGVPGLTLWILTQGTWLVAVTRSYLKARRRKHEQAAGLFLFLGGYWAAFMTNASFDVFIEGPMGGIWLWTIYGVGIASIAIYRKYPQLIEVGLANISAPRAAKQPRPFVPAPVHAGLRETKFSRERPLAERFERF